MKKRVLSVLLIMALFVSCLAFSASAEGTPTLRLSSVSASRGDEVTVDVIMENNPGVTGIDVKISYDKTRLKLTGFSNGCLSGWVVSVEAGGAIWADSVSHTENGVILTLKFEVLVDAPLGDAVVQLTNPDIIDDELNTVDFKFESGTVTVTCDHEWDAGVITTKPTCTDDGVKTFTCKKCNTTREEPITHEGHKSDAGTITTEPTCTETGVKTYKCTVCGEVIKTEPVPANGHKSDAGTITTEPTCTEKGEKTYKCTVCGEVLKTETVPEKGHSWDEGVVTTEPTCTEEGVKTYTCTVSDCKAIKTEVLPALDHDWDEGKVVKEATEKENGLKVYTCARCQETKEEVIKYSVPTGDEAMPALYALLLVASAGAAFVVTRKLRKERG